VAAVAVLTGSPEPRDGVAVTGSEDIAGFPMPSAGTLSLGTPVGAQRRDRGAVDRNRALAGPAMSLRYLADALFHSCPQGRLKQDPGSP